MRISLERLSRLELDEEGWVPIDAMLTAIREQGLQWSYVDRGDLDMIASSTKKRHEIDGERIRRSTIIRYRAGW